MEVKTIDLNLPKMNNEISITIGNETIFDKFRNKINEFNIQKQNDSVYKDRISSHIVKNLKDVLKYLNKSIGYDVWEFNERGYFHKEIGDKRIDLLSYSIGFSPSYMNCTNKTFTIYLGVEYEKKSLDNNFNTEYFKIKEVEPTIHIYFVELSENRNREVLKTIKIKDLDMVNDLCQKGYEKYFINNVI